MPGDTVSEQAVAARTPPTAGGGPPAVTEAPSQAIQTVELALRATIAQATLVRRLGRRRR